MCACSNERKPLIVAKVRPRLYRKKNRCWSDGLCIGVHPTRILTRFLFARSESGDIHRFVEQLASGFLFGYFKYLVLARVTLLEKFKKK